MVTAGATPVLAEPNQYLVAGRANFCKAGGRHHGTNKIGRSPRKAAIIPFKPNNTGLENFT